MFGANLCKARKKKGLTQTQMAKLCGCSQQAYQQYESGTKIPSLAMAIILAQNLKTTIDELVK